MPKVSQSYLDTRRNEILDAAWACFARKGYHLTTMHDICQECELSPGAVYRYFSSKEEILRATNERSQEIGRALVLSARERAGGPLDALEAIGQAMASSVKNPLFETRARVNMELWPEIIRNESLREQRQSEVGFWRGAVSELFAEAKAQGALRDEVDPDAAAVIFMCAFEGLRHLRLLDSKKYGPDTLNDLLQTMLSTAHRPSRRRTSTRKGVHV
ncbi:MAG: TetR/AcrR family transcriptional regulator [Dehalococcoidia bacterium]